jgi:cytochrome c oxidase subunit IV
MSDNGHHKPDIKLYLMVFGALLVLTVVTVLVSYWHLPPLQAVALGLLIASVKASLVVAFFMHLKGERAIIYSLLGMTVFFMLVLFAMPIWDTHEIAPRTHHIAVGGEHAAPAQEGAHH